jgi:hypothetical protein
MFQRDAAPKETLMKPSLAKDQPVVDDLQADSHMGSEYMNARTYLTQVAKESQVRQKQAEIHHGSNESDFGLDQLNAE